MNCRMTPAGGTGRKEQSRMVAMRGWGSGGNEGDIGQRVQTCSYKINFCGSNAQYCDYG